MKKNLLFLAALAALAIPISGDNNAWARRFGGTAVKQMPSGSKVVSASWKGNSLWVLLRERKPSETPETLVYQEFSNYGIIQGTVVLQEMP